MKKVFLAVIAAVVLSLTATAAAQACTPGQTQQVYVSCGWPPGALVVTYTCVGTGWWSQTGWRVLWGCA